MKLSQLSLADYNQLDNIPVINQDLTASGFTPVANTYYRHTGATTDTFTQGVIYLYDTAYHKLGESGGTTLNRYTYRVNLMSPTEEIRSRIMNIAMNAKKYSMAIQARLILSNNHNLVMSGYLMFGPTSYTYSGVMGNPDDVTVPIAIFNYGASISKIAHVIENNAIVAISSWESLDLTIIYYNDTEIT